MTTRDQAHRAAARLRVERGRQDALPDAEPSLHERLFAARERKGVDLFRAERDTKIRARYLAALERGDYRDLPGAVYTKGFLRNYALYLGLDPDEIINQWRRERADIREPQAILAVPRPIAAPRRGFSFSPGILVAALLSIGVVLFGAYLAMQLLRFAKPPTIGVTDPAVAVLEVEESTTEYVIRGTSVAGASIEIRTPGRERPYLVTAGADGSWSAQVDLRRGRNQFEVNATDPDTGKQAEVPVRFFITVPFLVIQAPTLRLDQPSDGATFENGAIPVEGTATNATRVVVSATWVGPAPIPGLPVDPSPTPVPSPTPAVSPGSSPEPGPDEEPPIPTPVDVAVREDGSFSTPFELTTGVWSLTVTAIGEQGKTAALTRRVTVAYKGVTLVVTTKGGAAWVKVWVDGVVDPSVGQSGTTLRDGRTLTFTGQESIEVRTGSSGVTFFTLNGTSLGALGKAGVPETWLFAPPDPPTRTQRR
jgi:hypothetical protein